MLCDFELVGFDSTITANNATTDPSMRSKLNELVHSEVCRMCADEDIEIDEYEALRRDIILLRCLAHVIQLGVKEGLKDVPAIDAAIGSFRGLIKEIHDSPKLREAAKHISKELGIEGVPRWELDVETRCNSTFDMARRPNSRFSSTYAQTFAGAARRKLAKYREKILNDRAIVAAVVDPLTKGTVLEKCDIFIEQQREAFVVFYEKFYQNI